ncbi:MAG: biliverdin-producing heme oxygenase [Terrimicrobiaceae bacterium]|nr:biliverdin-producing heme oxygenase [Terrimicrobiaceae bacterium]
MKTLATALRQATAVHHRAMEAKIDIAQIVADPQRCQSILASLLGFYEPLEKQLITAANWREWGIQMAARSKTRWLEEDLRTFELSPDAIAALPRCGALPSIDSPAAAIGCAYVLEGATLGGRQITQILKNAGRPPLRFFESYGDAVGENWLAFLRALELFERRGGDVEGACEAAIATFASLSIWIDPCRE